MAMVTDRYWPMPHATLMASLSRGTVRVKVQGLARTTVTWQGPASSDSSALASRASPLTATSAVRGVGLRTLTVVSYRLTDTLAMQTSALRGWGQSTSLTCGANRGR